MTETVTLEELRQKVLNRKQSLTDEVVSVKSLMMDPSQPGRMIVRRSEDGRHDSYVFDDLIYSQAAGVAYGLPGSYIKKLVEGDHADPGLAALNFNFWVDASKDKEVLLRFQKRGEENVLRAMKPASWNDIPYDSSIETLITKFGEDTNVNVTRFDDMGLVLDLITRKLDYKTNPAINDLGKRDDPIEWGIRFQDSDSGRGDLQIMPYTKRLVCMNGMTSTSKGVIMHISHSNKESRVIEEVQSTIRQGLEMVDGYSNRVADQITTSQGIELHCHAETGQPDVALNRLERDCGVTRLMQKYVREAWDEEQQTIPERTVYRLHNAITRAGTHAEELTHDSKLHLQSVGGRVLELASTNYIWN